MTLKNITSDVYTFNTLVDGLCKEGEVKKARNVIAVMIKQGVKPDVVTYTSLKDGYFLVKEFNKATYIFNQGRQERVPARRIVRSYVLPTHKRASFLPGFVLCTFTVRNEFLIQERKFKTCWAWLK